jgi:hypothetical protein
MIEVKFSGVPMAERERQSLRFEFKLHRHANMLNGELDATS